ncbi:MAG: glycosyltransferase [Anaerolineales bacterium]|nr:glycosyltransferase [Anaerolineales bacterium]
MSISRPLVTIVTSTYKHEKFLRRAIDSVLCQDYPEIEYLVFNDGSPDGTEEILKSYGRKLTWESQPNMGETATLNKAIGMAKGSLIAKLSSDDYLYPTAISEAVNQFIAQPNLAVVYSDFDLVDEGGRLLETIQKPDFDFISMVRNHLCLPGPGALFRKDIFDQLNGFDTSLRILFDMDFWWRAALIGPFVRIPKSLSAFRHHRNSQSSAGGEQMAVETIRFVKKYYSLPNLPKKILKEKRNALSNAYYAAGMQLAESRGNLAASKRFLVKSFAYSPRNYFKRTNRDKLICFTNVVISPHILPFVKRVLGRDKKSQFH